MSQHSDNEVLLIFYDESKEHLETIEDDLLIIESQGANFDDELINHIFRAVHTIKGGCCFFSLHELSSVSHVMETILDKIRKHEMVPTSDVISALLKGADQIKTMVYEPERTSELNYEEVVNLLKEILEGPQTSQNSVASDGIITIADTEGSPVFSIDRTTLEQAINDQNETKFLYLIRYDLIKDFVQKNRMLSDALNELAQLSDIIDSRVEVNSIPLLDQYHPYSDPIYFYILIASIIDIEILHDLLELELNAIKEISITETISHDSTATSSEIADFHVDDVVQVYQDLMKCKGHGASELAPISTVNESLENLISGLTNGSVNADMIVPASSNDSVCEAINTCENLFTKTSECKIEPDVKAKNEPAVATNEDNKINVDEETSSRKHVDQVPSHNDERPVEVIKTNALAKDPIIHANSKGKSQESSIRVNIRLLDRLMTLAGELVLTRNELLQNTHSQKWEALINTSQQVDLITAELQEAIMATRMQSIGLVFHKFNRFVRDLSKNLGKKVDLVLEGDDVELDKTIIESIGDPLTHIVRNSLDHGLESPEERLAAGKTEIGLLKISAFHEGGYVVIEIFDNGRGIDCQQVRRKAFSSGIISKEQMDTMGEKESIMLIFEPGFSTAEEITDLSGRGVGMDVVLTNLTKLGGSIDIDSVCGLGTKIKIKLPLTLAIIPSLLVSVGRERFAIPQVSLIELVRVSNASISTTIEYVGDAMLMRLRGHLLPLVDIRKSLGITSHNNDIIQTDSINIAVVMAGDISYGIVVDDLLDSSEIVVKPLGRHIKHCKEYAGATILGDGHVALILDVVGIRDKEGLFSIMSTANSPLNVNKGTHDDEEQLLHDKQTLLLVNNAEDEQFAIPLGLVVRIEKIEAALIESVGGRKAIHYRGSSLTLFSLEDVACVSPCAQKEFLYVVVFKISGREIGLLLSDINDIVENTSDVDELTYCQPGIFGSLIINNSITLIIDIYGLVYTAIPQWRENFIEAAISSEDIGEQKHFILVVEDSLFFMNQLVHFMNEVGYEVITANDGKEALQLLNENSHLVDLVITDIEMPVMTGLEFVVEVRKDPQFDLLPVLAVTSIAGEEASNHGLLAGFDEYLIKLDRDEIVERCAYYLANGRGVTV